ncbi:MAG: hypothetical protein GXO88_08565 [Chlorobi bacterium]|nr:hypothetical protein [Chlorobiota bacterium]
MNKPETSVELRSFRLSDAVRLAFLANNKKIWVNPRDGFPLPCSLKDAEIFIDNCMKKKPQTVFAILFDKELRGSIGLFKKEDVFDKAVYKNGKFVDEIRFALINTPK